MSAQVFHPSANSIAKAALFGAVVLVAGALALPSYSVRSPWTTNVNAPVAQPVPFSHEHHVGGLGIDCRYCHATVEKAAFPGIPPTETCMSCHSQIWTN